MSQTPNYPPKLQQALSALSPQRRDAFLAHLVGGTSADYLSDWLKRAGHPVGATTIKQARQRAQASA